MFRTEETQSYRHDPELFTRRALQLDSEENSISDGPSWNDNATVMDTRESQDPASDPADPDLYYKADPKLYYAECPIKSHETFEYASTGETEPASKTWHWSINTESDRHCASPIETNNSPRPEAEQPCSMKKRRVLDDYLVSEPVEPTDAVEGRNRHMPRPSTPREVIKAPRSKRSNQPAFSRENAMELEPDEHPTKWQTPGEPSPRDRFLACAFYKYNPHKYQECLGFRLTRIKDVKQHIYRKHTWPDLYCSRCYVTFDTASERDEHARYPRCDIKTEPQFDGITEEQKKSLKQYVSRPKSVEEQWFEIWDIVFPGSRRPESVFVGKFFEEAMPLLRACWTKWEKTITSSVVDTGQFPGVDQKILGEAMSSVLYRFGQVAVITDAESYAASARSDGENGATSGAIYDLEKNYSPETPQAVSQEPSAAQCSLSVDNGILISGYDDRTQLFHCQDQEDWIVGPTDMEHEIFQFGRF